MKIKIFITGGTFDKEYNELTGSLFVQRERESHLPEILKVGRCRLETDLTTLMMIDSLDMRDEDRKVILENCKNAPEDRIVITHGTDTMIETAKILAREIKDKTIVLTGAMIPYKFGNSDALFNIGCALAFLQILSPGIYIAMNGKYFNWNNVRKNKDIGEFEEIQD